MDCNQLFRKFESLNKLKMGRKIVFFGLLLIIVLEIYLFVLLGYKVTFIIILMNFVIFMPYIFLFSYQFSLNASDSNMFIFGSKNISLVFKKDPFLKIPYDRIKKIKIIENDSHSSILIAVYTPKKIYYIGNSKIQRNFLYEVEKHNLQSLVDKKVITCGKIREIFFRLKGGKVEERK